MFESVSIADHKIAPALFLAPMAGVTNSAFRRLLADFGGYGALFTEMLSATAFLQDKTDESPFIKRRACEGHVIYQFRVSGEENLEAVFARMREIECTAIDLNLGCPAPEIQQKASGAALWRDFPRLKEVLERIRRCYDGPLTVYDLERARRLPDVVVLSSCHLGLSGAFAGDELAGLTQVLLGMGTRNVIASVTATPDSPATVELMASLHRHLAMGTAPTDAMVRAAAESTPEAAAVAAAFGVFGA